MRGDLEERLRELLDEQQLRAVIALLERERLHDPLTGLPNRVLLLDRTATAVARLRRGSWRVALMHVGIDRLNVLNETLGLSAGDELLRALGPRRQGARARACRPRGAGAAPPPPPPPAGGGVGSAFWGGESPAEPHAVRIAERI